MFYSLTEMRGAAMSLTAAASGLVVFLLSVSVVQGQDGWRVSCSSTEICAVKGSTVEIRCSYTYPSSWNNRVNTLEKTLWLTKQKGGKHVDLNTVSEYAGRVEDLCGNNICTLRIRNLRESDSAEYRFMFKTNQATYWANPVTLSVTDLQVQVSRSGSSTLLRCLSSCSPGQTSYIWFKNREEVKEDTSSYAYFRYESADSYSCALKGYEDFPSPSVYAPKLPSVSVSPFGEIEQGSSVTLTCSSDANPAANYTWYKRNGSANLSSVKVGPRLVLSSIQSSDSGQYYCRTENLLGRRRSESISIDVKYAPKLPSVSVSPSAEIEEGSSVTLTCSSDANPAANYTWYKRNEDSPKASGQIFNITDFRAEHSGSYSCGAQNKLGRSNSTFHLIVVAWSSTMIVNIIRTTLGVLILILALLLSLWMRKKKALRSTTEAPEEIELDSDPEYENNSHTAAQTEDTEEQEDMV
ncbi:B-cell receptor CD22-like isoform X1 [Gymnodraco acuticeps]|uniref:B-cell receptor CD22-like isoform X1 n=1 Tax=Gymnodraco acuticeps TaxID=8218 RepID=A0A6P8SZ98_GYMAC|nr:B-cell receptor CD22-like isoform X1 [Gymnodraco acuticeps]XP_034056137.1 B-cell receptor CD22-like isoform X1 [Gymnodraco acuticeps]